MASGPAASTEELATRLHSVAIHLLRYARGEDRHTGLSPARLSVLSVLVFGGPRTPSELARAEQVTGPTMTGLLRGLEADGFIERRPHPDDARSTIVTATDPARTALEDGRARRVRQLMRVVEPLTPPDRRSLERAVEALEASLSQAHERDPA